MHHSKSVMLFNDKIRAIVVQYDPQDTRLQVNLTQFKTLDQSIKKDDLVIVPTQTRHGMTVVKVLEADVDVDFEDGNPISWIVGKVDVVAYEAVLAEEKKAIDIIRASELRKKRETMRLNMGEMMDEDLKKLSITGPSSAAEEVK